MATAVDTWSGEGVSAGQIERALAALRQAPGEQPRMRTSVMTHLAWVPPDWRDPAWATLEGLRERHPSRTLILVPHPEDDEARLDATVWVECFALPGVERRICSEVVELQLRGGTAAAPASVVEPLLVADLPIFLRWRGQPSFGEPALEQLVGVADRLIVDSTEWLDLPGAYGGLVDLFPRVAASDIAWARTIRWRTLLASLWPGIADVRRIRVRGTKAQACLLAGWLRSRLGHHVVWEHEPADRLEGIDLDDEPAPFPPGDPPSPSDLLSDELDRYDRDPVYEAAVAAAALG